jgi:hypothetical protein
VRSQLNSFLLQGFDMNPLQERRSKRVIAIIPPVCAAGKVGDKEHHCRESKLAEDGKSILEEIEISVVERQDDWPLCRFREVSGAVHQLGYPRRVVPVPGQIVHVAPEDAS